METSAGYEIRHFQQGNEQRFYGVIRLAGWLRWDAKRLDYSLYGVLPNWWFMAVEEQSKTVVGTAMCLHNYTRSLPFRVTLDGWHVILRIRGGARTCIVRRENKPFHRRKISEDLPAHGVLPVTRDQDLPEAWLPPNP